VESAVNERLERLLTAREAAEYLHISLLTLAKVEREGALIPFRTPGGHRRYSLQMLGDYLERSRRPPGPRGRGAA
jgi:excisionase family DNA binding protein